MQLGFTPTTQRYMEACTQYTYRSLLAVGLLWVCLTTSSILSKSP